MALAGVSLVLLGFVGMISMRKDAHSMRTLYLSGAVIVGLLSWAFISQVRTSLVPFAWC